MENNNKEESREFYVYKHIRKDNNTCFYVGKGKGCRIYVPKRNKHYNRIRKKYGCYVVKIKENLTEKEAFALEREIIEDYVFVFGYGINIKGYYKGYNENEHLTNCTWGGEGVSGLNPYENKTEEEMKEIGNKISEKLKGKNKGKYVGEKSPMFGKNPFDNKTPKEMEEIRKKMSEKAKGKHVGEKNGMWGKQPPNKGKKGLFHHSEEAKMKMSKSSKGKTAGEKNGMYGKKGKDSPMWGKPAPNRRNVICITTGETFDCIKDASDHYNVAQSSISLCCRGKKYKYVGRLSDGTKLQWKYLEDYNN